MISVKAKHLLIMGGSYKKKVGKVEVNPVIKIGNERKFSRASTVWGSRALPSPKPKQGIKLSSSNGAKVFPTTEIAFSYGLGSFPMACRLRLLNETLPSVKTTANQLQRYTSYNYLFIFYDIYIYIYENCSFSVHPWTCPFIAFCKINSNNQIRWL